MLHTSGWMHTYLYTWPFGSVCGSCDDDEAFKKRAPRAIKEIRAFAEKAMGTSDVRLDPQLNKKVWESGIKGVPFRLRVRISRKRNDEESAKEKLYSYVQAVNVKNPKGLQTAVVEDAA
ncbi:ribosomal protein L31e [Dissoconium aciculare CBS 342.82]|uniref:Ribosomal protein L31e n=1 Tax=Dissoconium aciculare CBS 342.82 TaxID=1314786 RepID=A0A6J3LZZ3_9PEZI|nr:ribosomal protein L31e [Dissoconium aciculare CBS 342.82]KAF1820207.1 ribosomal protein L31e [Dissoconium aciculare CBS 342.82]